jgi:integrase/recombinase XerD
MRVYRQTYKNKRGGISRVKKWYIEVRDHHGVARKVPGFTDQSATKELGRMIEKLVALRTAGAPPDAELAKWLENVPARMRTMLGRWGVVEGHRLARFKPVDGHLEDFRQHQTNRGVSEKQVDQVCSRAKRLFQLLGVENWTDITPSTISHAVASLKAERDVCARTLNFHVAAAKQFGKWLCAEGRATENPFANVKPFNTAVDQRHPRRALTVTELRKLLAATATAPAFYKISGAERVALYRVAVETGLRANELRTLTADQLHLEGPQAFVTVRAIHSKHRREDRQPISEETAKVLLNQIAGKERDAFVFHMPRVDHVAKMLRADLERAGIPYKDEAGLFADFHSLRHTFLSNLAGTKAHPKVAQQLGRHSTIALTMDRYTHSERAQEYEALKNLPDLSLPEAQTSSASTKPGGEKASEEDLSSSLSSDAGFQRIGTDNVGQPDAISVAVANPVETALEVAPRPESHGKMAEEEGFEPPCTFRHNRFSKPTQSAALPLLLNAAPELYGRLLFAQGGVTEPRWTSPRRCRRRGTGRRDPS